MKYCLCCLDEEENGVDIRKSCSEGWVCKECLTDYRKHWGSIVVYADNELVTIL